MEVLQSKQQIYWEKQGVGLFCGVHCINSLLQGPIYNEVYLGQIAQQIDEKEQSLLTSYLKVNSIQDGTNNVDVDGNFSVQVIIEVLKKQNLVVESIDSKNNAHRDLSHEIGFICHSKNHWFTIRRIGKIWYNLNSTNRNGPQIISDFYLSVFLESVKENGYIIFVVRGIYPEQDPTVRQNIIQFAKLFFDMNKNQHFFPVEKIQQMHENRMKKKRNNHFSYELSSDESNGTIQKGRRKNKKKIEDDLEFQIEKVPSKKVKVGNTKLKKQGKQKSRVNYDKFNLISEEPELKEGLLQSLSEKFKEMPEFGVTIGFIMSNDQYLTWNFQPDASIEDLYDFIAFNMQKSKTIDFELALYPDIPLLDVNEKLISLGISEMSQIVVTKY